MDEELAHNGVNVFGYLRAESGVGEHTRLLVAAVKQAGIPYSVTDFPQSTSRQQHPYDDWGHPRPIFDVQVVGVNADELPRFVELQAEPAFGERYTIALWAWEVEEFPDPMAASARFVDEIWANSSFSARAIAAKVGCPVFPFPLPIAAPPASGLGRADLKLPDGFLVLFCFDFDSVFERKNPLAAVEAFRRAFRPGQAHLVLKSVNGERHPRQLARLLAAAAGRPDVLVRDGYLTAPEQAALLRCCDAYVSLHRAEGFGLTLGEAMALGKPVVATGYSGNLDFMHEDNSFLVDYRLVPVPPESGPYPPSTCWAEPDVDAAAEQLRRVFHDRAACRRRCERALADIARFHSPAARAGWIARRLADVRRTWRRRIAVPRPTVDAAAVAAAWEELRQGPDVAAPSRLGPIAIGFRRLILRLLQNYHVYVLDAFGRQHHLVRELAAELARSRDVERKLSRRLVHLESRLAGVKPAGETGTRHDDAGARGAAAESGPVIPPRVP